MSRATVHVMRHGEVVGRFAVGDVTETDVAHLISTGVMAEGGSTSNERRLIGSTTSGARSRSRPAFGARATWRESRSGTQRPWCARAVPAVATP